MPKLVQVMLAYGDGGAETFFEKLAIEFQKAGLEQTLIIQAHPEREARLTEAGCEVRVINARGWRKHFAKPMVGRICREVGAKVALAWMSRGAAAVPKMKGLARVARVGGYYRGKYFTGYDAVVGNAPGVIEWLEKQGVSKENLRLIPNFSEDLNEKSQGKLADQLNLPSGAPVAASVGRLKGVKGHDISIRVAAAIPELHLLIAGGGPKEEELRTLAKELGVEQRVHFLGWCREMGEVYRLADVVLFPTRSEPFGNVIVEAWRQRVPIVTSNLEGPAWLVDEGETGLLCEKNDVEAFTDAVKRVLADGELANRLVANGGRVLEERFSTEAIVAAYQKLFSELTGGRGTR
ncbi:MAG: glycosyltransferase [Verrucomicrobiota bacterium JB023]|nr:glycosyltransferase [Verrucomicrobiota bacterium JB023]